MTDNMTLDTHSSRIVKKHLACFACKAYPREGVYSCSNGYSVCYLCIDPEGGSVYLFFFEQAAAFTVPRLVICERALDSVQVLMPQQSHSVIAEL